MAGAQRVYLNPEEDIRHGWWSHMLKICFLCTFLFLELLINTLLKSRLDHKTTGLEERKFSISKKKETATYKNDKLSTQIRN